MQNPQFVAATQMLVQACAPCQAPWIGRAAAHTARSHRGEAKPVLPGRSWSLTRKSGRIVRPALPKNVAARTRALLLQGICRPFRLLFSDRGRLNERPAERAQPDGRGNPLPRQPQGLQVIRKRRIGQADLEARRLLRERKHAARRAAALRIVHQHPHQHAAVPGEGR